MSKQPNNPAGRLLAIIRKLQAVLKKKGNMSTDEAWAEVFQINPNNTGLLMDRIGKCLQLGNQIINDEPFGSGAAVCYNTYVETGFTAVGLKS